MIRQEKYQVGYPDYDVVGVYFSGIAEGRSLHDAFIEIKQNEYCDDKIHMLTYKNRMIAFVIERRDDFNDIEYTLGEI